MKHLSRILGASLAVLACSPAFADGPRSIKIGVLNDASGPYSDNAGEGSVTAARMAAEDVMRLHPDFKVEIISADHQNKADVGAAIALRWIDQEKVDAVADVPNSAVGLAVNEVVRGSKAALIASSAASSDLTGKYCSPNTIQWTFDTWAPSHTIGAYLVRHDGKKWYFIATDNALGKSMVRDGTAVIGAGGGTVLGSVNVSINNADYASFILQADGSGADVIAFATAGGDTVNLIKQSAEFGLKQNGRTFAALLTTTNDVEASGLAVAQGLIITQPVLLGPERCEPGLVGQVQRAPAWAIADGVPCRGVFIGAGLSKCGLGGSNQRCAGGDPEAEGTADRRRIVRAGRRSRGRPRHPRSGRSSFARTAAPSTTCTSSK
jgi:branched-chain amino acid transport system substrate-binding protein